MFSTIETKRVLFRDAEVVGSGSRNWRINTASFHSQLFSLQFAVFICKTRAILLKSESLIKKKKQQNKNSEFYFVLNFFQKKTNAITFDHL